MVARALPTLLYLASGTKVQRRCFPDLVACTCCQFLPRVIISRGRGIALCSRPGQAYISAWSPLASLVKFQEQPGDLVPKGSAPMPRDIFFLSLILLALVRPSSTPVTESFNCYNSTDERDSQRLVYKRPLAYTVRVPAKQTGYAARFQASERRNVG